MRERDLDAVIEKRDGQYRCPYSSKRRYERDEARKRRDDLRNDIIMFRCSETGHWHVGRKSKAPPAKLRIAQGRTIQ